MSCAAADHLIQGAIDWQKFALLPTDHRIGRAQIWPHFYYRPSDTG